MSCEQQVAAEVFTELAENANSGTTIARQAERAAYEAEQLQHSVTVGMHQVMNPADTQYFSTEIVSASTSNEQQIDYQVVANTLNATAKDVRQIVGSESADNLDEDVAGQAMQGQDGSMVIDVAAAVRPQEGMTSVIDTTMLSDTVKHEAGHEVQASPELWDTHTVDIGNGQQLTHHIVSEVGSMSLQESIEWVHPDYKAMWDFWIGLGLDPARAQEAAVAGEMIPLANEIRKKRGLPLYQENANVPQFEMSL